MATESELAGWVWTGDQLAPLNTVNGYLARGESLVGSCKTRQCRRRVEVDLQSHQRLGFGKTDIATIKSAWRCGSGPCELQWGTGQYPGGVPLQSYVGQGCTVVISCAGCQRSKSYDVSVLIETLRRRGVGDGNTSVLKVAEVIRHNCPSCGRMHWEAKFVWPQAHGQARYAGR